LFETARPAVYEFRAVQPGVHFVDSQARLYNLDDRGTRTQIHGWQALDWSPGGAVAHGFVPALHEYDRGSMFFAPRSIAPHADGHLRVLDVRLMLSVEAGFETNHGGVVEVEVFRDNVYIGTAEILHVEDPIFVTSSNPPEIFRDNFDVLALTPVASFTVEETAVGMLETNDTLWFHLQATQDGRRVNIPMGNMSLFLGEPIINESESGFDLITLSATAPGQLHQGSIGFRVRRASRDVPASITFNDVYVAGPTVPGVEWHVVVTSQEFTENYYAFHPAAADRNQWQERLVFYGMAYYTTVLIVDGVPSFEAPGDGTIGGGQAAPSIGRLVLRQGMPPIEANDGSLVHDPFILHQFVPGTAVSLLNPRVFADFIGGDIEWRPANQTVIFSGPNANGQNVEVSLTIGSNMATINGQSVDIATFAGSSGPANSVQAIIVQDRSYVPLRFLANAFLLPISFQDGTVTLG